ncbi:MAG: S8 family peptidase [Opitutaceae bacterium]|nr:S8 family peptidase [Cytophagales bacterium]
MPKTLEKALLWMVLFSNKVYLSMAMSKVLFITLFILFGSRTFAQKSYFFIHFKDKPGSKEFFEVTSRSSLRRTHQNLKFDYSDLSVDTSYINSISKVPDLRIILSSKWLNGVLINSENSSLKVISQLPFVNSVTFVSKNTKDGIGNSLLEYQSTSSFDYGNAGFQVQSLKADKMHDMCLNGAGIYIAVFDGGFQNANQIQSLAHIFQQNRLKFTYNIVENQSDVFSRHVHGTNVLSCLAGYSPGKLIGTGFGSDFALIITEDVKSEKKIEEYYWLKGAEMADSLGVDIISSSLGYYTFDDTSENHQLSELDGKTTVITKAAAMAARKGILVVNSAGNNYNVNSWRKIVFPCDADSILSVGAVDNNFSKSSFSAIGPSEDGRIKLEVSAFGSGVTINNSGNSFYSGSGTSYSAPLITGLAAGLWQSNRGLTNIQIRNAIIQSSSLYLSPNNEIGYGIPDFEKAYNLLNSKFFTRCKEQTNSYDLYPNPVSDLLTIQSNNFSEGTEYYLFDLNGKEITNGIINVQSFAKLKLDFTYLGPGIYILKIGDKQYKIVKI